MQRDYGYALVLMEKAGIENLEVPPFHDPGHLTDGEWVDYVNKVETQVNGG